MQYRTLGKTGIKVSEVSFGGWGIGDYQYWGQGNETESLKALKSAFDLGVNFFDTARVYGYAEGRSEKLIGKLIAEVGRDKLYVASKVPPKNWHWPSLPNVPISEVFPKEWILKNVNESLANLGIDSIDLMQFHVWQDYFVEDDSWKEVVESLTKEGKVKHWGLSLNDYQPDNCKKTVETGLIGSVQLIFNIFHQKPIEIFPFFKEKNIGVIARVPLDEGGLSGNIDETTAFSYDDFRSDYFKGDRKVELVKRLGEIKKLIGAESKSLPEFALRFVLSFDEVTTVIPGMRSAEHVEKNVSVSDGHKLSAKVLEELKSCTWERNFYS